MRLQSVKEESDASRLRSLKSFLYGDCSFFVSMMFVLQKHRGNLRGRKGYAWKSVDRCGDCWKDRTQRIEEGIIVFPTYTPVLTVS